MARKPNILLIVADQLAPHFLPVYGHSVTKTPNIDWIAENGTVFDAAYTNSPLCVPARAGLFTGQLPSNVGSYDSAGDFPSSTPTMGHYLRNLGYHTCIAGKCHFIGPDQLHGFEDRTTTDICPAEMIWYSHWDRDGERTLPWYHTFDNVKNAGIAERSTQQDHDFSTAYTASQWLYDWRRGQNDRPFFMHLSFTHPHDPYVTPQKYWDRFRHDDIDMPVTPYIPLEERDPYSAWLYRHYDRSELDVTDDDIRRSRHGYYGNIALVDDLIGSVFETLRSMREMDNTIVLLTADHGEMLGERGQWYKMSPFERSARIPMIISVPGMEGGRRTSRATSQIDLLPALVSLATDRAKDALVTPIDGGDMTGLLQGDDPSWPDTAVVELFFEGLTQPAVAYRKGRYKYVRINDTDAMLFDLVDDPEEQTDLRNSPEHRETVTAMQADLAHLYDFDALRRDIVATQDRHDLVCKALAKGRLERWAFQPFTDAGNQYYRTTKTWHEQEAADFLRFDR
ncbi:MAG: choline-sulfatase [Alphaproteobacteria bacterium]